MDTRRGNKWCCECSKAAKEMISVFHVPKKQTKKKNYDVLIMVDVVGNSQILALYGGQDNRIFWLTRWRIWEKEKKKTDLDKSLVWVCGRIDLVLIEVEKVNNKQVRRTFILDIIPARAAAKQATSNFKGLWNNCVDMAHDLRCGQNLGEQPIFAPLGISYNGLKAGLEYPKALLSQHI